MKPFSPILFALLATFVAMPAHAVLMLDKPISDALLKRSGASVKADDVNALAAKLKSEYGIEVNFLSEGNKDVRSIASLNLFGVKEVGHFGIADYNKESAAKPLAVALLQLQQVEASASELSAADKALLKQRKTKVVLFAESHLRSHRLQTKLNQVQLVNSGRAQACQRSGRDFRDNDFGEDFLGDLDQATRTGTCFFGGIGRGLKDVLSNLTGDQPRHPVGFLHSKREIKHLLNSTLHPTPMENPHERNTGSGEEDLTGGVVPST